MTSVVDRHLYSIFLFPSKLLAKFRGCIYGYIRLLLGMVCSVSCIFCVFTFIWYLTFRGLYGFLINLQLYQPPTGCGADDDSDLTIEYTDYQSGKRGSFLTRCRAQAELIQQSLKKSRINGGNGPNVNSVKLSSGDSVTSENNSLNHHHSPNKENSSHGQLLVRNSSYVSEVYYDENGHKIGEQIYLTNDSDGLEESYFQFKVNDYQHLKELGGLSTSVLVEEEPFDDGAQQPQQNAEPDVEMVADPIDKDGAIAVDFEGEIIDSTNSNIGNAGNGKERNVVHVPQSHSPESTTSYCGSCLIDEPRDTYENDSDAKTVTINNTILTCSTTTIIPTTKPSNQHSLLNPEMRGNDSSNNNNREQKCAATQVQSNNEYPIELVKEEGTKDSTIDLSTVPVNSTVSNNGNCRPNSVQSNGNESEKMANSESKSTSLNGVDKSQNGIKDQPPNPSIKRKRKRRNNMNKDYNQSKNS